MVDRIYLHGSEDVSQAGYTIASAADSMRTIAANLDETLAHHRRCMEEWLGRFEAAVDKLAQVAQGGPESEARRG